MKNFSLNKKKLNADQIKNFKDELDKANQFEQFQDIANRIVIAGDTLWAKKIYIKALKKAYSDEIFCFQNADNFFKADREIVLQTVKKWGPAIQYADKKFKSDRNILLATKPYLAAALDHVSKIFLKDKEIIIESIKQSEKPRYILQMLNKSMLKDKDIVLPAIKKDGLALEFANKIYKKDKKIVKTAIKNNGEAFKFADKKLRANKEIILFAFKYSYSVIRYVDKKLKEYREIVLAAVKQNGIALLFVDDKYKANKEIVLIAVKKNGHALEYADDSLKKDKEVVLAAIKNERDALQYADDSLKKDKKFILEGMKNHKTSQEYILNGPELNYDFIKVDLKKINSKEKLTKYLLDFVENPPDQITSHLVLGNLKSEDKDTLKSNYLSIEDSSGFDDIKFKNKNTGEFIKPKKGHAILVFYYYYDHGIYKMNTKKKINDIYLETKHFNDEAIISKTDYSDFEIRAEEASGGGDHRFKIIFEDNYTFEGSGEEWIEEVSDHLKSIGVIK